MTPSNFSVTDYGSTLVRLLVPDKNGKPTDVVLGYDDLAGYVADDTCFGNNVGRSANRIGGASFTLNGTEYKLAANDGEIIFTAVRTLTRNGSGT